MSDELHLTIRYEDSGDGWLTAQVVVIPGAISEGRTLREARRRRNEWTPEPAGNSDQRREVIGLIGVTVSLSSLALPSSAQTPIRSAPSGGKT